METEMVLTEAKIKPSPDAGLVERLPKIASVIEIDGYGYEANVIREAAAALEAKDAEFQDFWQRYVDANEALIDVQAEIERLREALENIQTWCQADPTDSILGAIDGAARAALKGGNG